MSPATAVTRSSHSLGVIGFFRVYTPDGSSLLVYYLDFSLTSYDATLAVFPFGAFFRRCQRQ